MSVANMHAKSNLLSLQQRRNIQLLGLMYQHKQNPINLRLFPRNTRGANRETFHLERFQNCKYKNSLYYVGAELWNTLPLDLTQIPTLYQFKCALKKLYKKYKETE